MARSSHVVMARSSHVVMARSSHVVMVRSSHVVMTRSSHVVMVRSSHVVMARYYTALWPGPHTSLWPGPHTSLWLGPTCRYDSVLTHCGLLLAVTNYILVLASITVWCSRVIVIVWFLSHFGFTYCLCACRLLGQQRIMAWSL